MKKINLHANEKLNEINKVDLKIRICKCVTYLQPEVDMRWLSPLSH